MKFIELFNCYILIIFQLIRFISIKYIYEINFLIILMKLNEKFKFSMIKSMYHYT